tara:strand:+ start:2318 stop:2647 length:330 start_codon:yes stop_codon:yes gene_type:complete
MYNLLNIIDCYDIIIEHIEEPISINAFYKSNKNIYSYLKNSKNYYKKLLILLENIAQRHYKDRKFYYEKYYMLKSHLQYITYMSTDEDSSISIQSSTNDSDISSDEYEW